MRWLILLVYPAFGLSLGLADPGLGKLAEQAGVRAGWATAVSVNLLLPLVAVVLAWIHARVWAAWLGAASMMIAFIAGLAVRYSGPLHGPLSSILTTVPPQLVVAAVAYAVLGAVAARAGRLRMSPLAR